MSSVFKFGDYEHPANEVNMTRYEVTSMRSKRNNQIYNRLHVHGVIKATQADTPSLKTRIEGIIDAYKDDLYVGDATYTVDGVLTPHTLLQADSSSGLRVKYRSWPEGKPAEWANMRTFSVVLESIQIEVNGKDPDFLWFQDTISHIGNAGRVWKYRKTQANEAQARDIYPRGTQTIIQEGSALGLNTHMAGVLDGAAKWHPAGDGLEHEEQRVRKFGTGVWHGKGFQEFPFNWRYVYESNVSLGDNAPIDI